MHSEVEFLRVRDTLLARFETWLADGRRAGDAADAGLALDWKWSYGDGELARWRTADVAEFLLDWCPRKLSVGQADFRSIPGSLAAFAEFLDATAQLAPGSAPVSALTTAAADLADDFVGAMGDESNFGMAKSLFGAAAGDGVDFTDPDQVQKWMDEFNARPEDERRRVIRDSALPRPPRRPALPPVAMPTDGAVEASKAQAPILAMFAGLSTYVGDGRKLTQRGNLTMADARALVELLGTGDVLDERIGDRVFTTRSSAELRRLTVVFAWARKAGVVRVVHGRVMATKQGRALAGKPSASFDRAADALLAIGALSCQRSPDWWPDVNRLLDDFVVHLLTGPYVAQGPLPIEDLADMATEAVLDTFRFTRWGDEEVARSVASDVVDMVDVLELAGVVRRHGAAVPEEDAWLRRRQGGTVELTPAGVAITQRWLQEMGCDSPVAGQFVHATATDLFKATAGDDLPEVWGEVKAWIAGRSPAEAAAGLAAAVRELPDIGLSQLALAVMGELDPEVAGAEVRRLATDPGARGFALCWLVDHNLEDPVGAVRR